MKLSKSMIVSAGVVLMAAGCATDGSEPKDFFAPMDENRATTQFINAQANSAAHEDATLASAHFTGSKLNSLGTEKLTRLVPEESGEEVTVNLDLKAGDLANSRRDAVVGFLKNAGVAESSIKVKIGPNDGATHPAAEQISRMSKTELGGAGSSSTISDESAGGSTLSN